MVGVVPARSVCVWVGWVIFKIKQILKIYLTQQILGRFNFDPIPEGATVLRGIRLSQYLDGETNTGGAAGPTDSEP